MERKARGDNVKVVHGPYAGCTGQVVTVRSAAETEDVMVKLDNLGRSEWFPNESLVWVG